MTEADFSIVLLRPEIPHNTGAIGRLCVGLGVPLHLVRPLGFALDDRYVARAGLDYWPHLDVRLHDTWEDYLASQKCQTLLTHGGFAAGATGERAVIPVGGVDGSILMMAQIAIDELLLH